MDKQMIWEGDGWVFTEGWIEFQPDGDCLTESDLLLPVEDGEGVWITVTKLPKLEGEDGQD